MRGGAEPSPAPSQSTCPRESGSRPQRRLSSVVLPQPDGPTMPTISPRRNENEIDLITSTGRPSSSPNVLPIPDAISSVSGGCASAAVIFRGCCALHLRCLLGEGVVDDLIEGAGTLDV